MESVVHRNVTAKETRDQAIRRLALMAREKGIDVYVYDLGPRAVEYYATSASRPGTLHRVTLFSCDCPAFIRHQRCCHHARLLDEVGELPEPDPLAEAARQERRAEITSARIEVARIRKFAKSTSDFHALELAKQRLSALVESDLVIQRPEPALAA